jgi:hypothetical protein
MARKANTYRANGAPRSGHANVKRAWDRATWRCCARTRDRVEAGRWGGIGDWAAARSLAKLREAEAKKERKRVADRARRANKKVNAT